jgi:PmbA protein
METTLILKPYAAAELLQFAFAPSFSADNVQRRRSVLANKIGEELFPGIEVIDDGAIAGGLMSAKFDSEGVKTQKTVLVSKGVLKGFIYDTYTANKGKTKSTGNAERDSYASPPRIGPSNFVLKGKGKIGNGLVVHGLIGCHTANPVSGDFSVETRNAFLNGEPVKAMISGNIFDLLKKCVGFGDDYKQVSFVKCPSIEFSSIKVV